MLRQREAALVTDEQFDMAVEALNAQKDLLEKLIVEVKRLQGRDHATMVFTAFLCRVLSQRGVVSGDELAAALGQLIAEVEQSSSDDIRMHAREHLKKIEGMLRKDRNPGSSRRQ